MNRLRHFDIHASNAERAKAFYERIFDWKGVSYPGADEFFQLRTSDGEVIGAIAGRKYNVHPKDVLGFECSISVDDVDETVRKVEAAGGKTLMAKTAIRGVGWIAKFMDTEGNLFAAIRYDKSAT
jgi:predicted enzyme related to lactoylglutathione lyase